MFVDVQRQLLQAEGIEFDLGGRVLDCYQWEPRNTS